MRVHRVCERIYRIVAATATADIWRQCIAVAIVNIQLLKKKKYWKSFIF